MKFSYWFASILAGILLVVSVIYLNKNISQYPVWENLAAVFFSQGPQVNDLVKKYVKAPRVDEKIKILLAPGHEPNYGGAEYRGLKEREMNVDLAKRIKLYLERDKHFEVVMTRDDLAWNSELAQYFTNNWEDIKKWRIEMSGEMNRLVGEGKVKLINNPYHGTAPADPANRLYGINKWASENDFDIVINIHFNDNPKINGKPVFSGFSIYVPEKQYSNSIASVTLANDIFKQLSAISSPSDLAQEKDGIVEDQELVAIGRFNTLDALGLLIEYAYIYEPALQTEELRSKYLDDMALRTYSGLVNFFESRIRK